MEHSFSKNIVLFLLCSIGVLIIPYLKIKLNPSPDSQSLSVSYSYLNASPEVIESEVTSVLESIFSTLRYLDEIKSISVFGKGDIEIIFKNEADIEKARLEIAMLIRQIYPALPSAVSYPIIKLKSPYQESQTLLVYTLTSPLSTWKLEQLIDEQIRVPLSNISGISEVNITGIQPLEYQIIVQENILNDIGLSIDEIHQSLQGFLSQKELGIISTDYLKDRQFLSVTFSNTNYEESPKEVLNNIIVGVVNNRPIFFKDIARVQLNEQKRDNYFRVNSKQAVNLYISADKVANQIDLGEQVKQQISQARGRMKGLVNIELVKDQTSFLQEELNKVISRAFAAGCILFLFIILRPQWRYIVLLSSGLLAVLLISNIFYYIFGIELNLYSIAGWTLSIGIVLDNIIVMSDHIRLKNNQSIFLAILAATLTSIGALVVIFFAEERFKLSLTDFSWVFITNLSVSLFVALVFIPPLFHSLGIKSNELKISQRRKRMIVRFNQFYIKYILFTVRRKGMIFTMLLLGFGLPIFLLPDQVEEDGHSAGNWRFIYNQTIGSPAYQKIRPVSDLVLGGALKVFFDAKDRFNFYPTEKEQIQLFVNAKVPFGATIEQLNGVMQRLEREIAKHKGVDKYQTSIYAADNAMIVISFLRDFENSSLPYILKNNLERLATEIGGVDFSIFGVGQGFSNELFGERLSIHLQLLGFNYKQIQSVAEQIKEKLLKNRKIQEVRINSRKTYFATNDEYFKANILSSAELKAQNLSSRELIKQLVNSSPDKGIAGNILHNSHSVPVRLLSNVKEKNNLWTINNSLQSNNDSIPYKNASVIKLSKEKGHNDIVRINQQYQLVIESNFFGSDQLAHKALQEILEDIYPLIPLGYTVKELEKNRRKNQGDLRMIKVICIAFLVIFLISSILFNSWRQAFIPLFIIAPSYIGIFLSVLLFDFQFDLGGFASFLLVAGLAVNPVFFIINDYNNERKANPNRIIIRSYIKAFNSKIIPILLTILSTILGLIPFIIFDANEEFWSALAICSISGIVFSTIAGISFLPALFIRRKHLTAK